MKNNAFNRAIEDSIFTKEREDAIRDKYIDLVRRMYQRSKYFSMQKNFSTFVQETIGKKEFQYFIRKFYQLDSETNEIVP